MSDTKWAVAGFALSHLVALVLWYAVEDEEFRKRIERGDFR